MVQGWKVKPRLWLLDCGWNIELMEWVGAGELNQLTCSLVIRLRPCAGNWEFFGIQM